MPNLFEVEMIKNSHRLKDAYYSSFKERYGAIPHTTDKDDETMRWAVINFRFEKSKSLIEHFIEMNTEWFVQQGHALYCFRKNINLVIASLGKKNRSSSGNSMRIDTEVYCDQCGSRHRWICSVTELIDQDRLRLCDNCRGDD